MRKFRCECLYVIIVRERWIEGEKSDFKMWVYEKWFIKICCDSWCCIIVLLMIG